MLKLQEQIRVNVTVERPMHIYTFVCMLGRESNKTSFLFFPSSHFLFIYFSLRYNLTSIHLNSIPNGEREALRLYIMSLHKGRSNMYYYTLSSLASLFLLQL